MRTETTSLAMAGPLFASLLQCVAGLRNRNAVVALFGCTFVGLVLFGLLLATSGGPGFLAVLAGLVWLLALATGINAAGLLQMDHARGISPRSLGDALIQGVTCIPKLIVLGLALLATAIGVFIVLALLLALCRIPFLGPLLFVVVFPLSAIVAGVTVSGLVLCLVLSLPAIWQGASLGRALAQTFAIVKSRLVEAILLLVLLGFVCVAVGLIVSGVLMAGLMPTIGLSLSIVGFAGVDSEAMMAIGQGYALDGHALAGLIGALLLWAVAGSLVGQVGLFGLSQAYLRLTEGLDLSASEAALRAAFDDARRRTAELGAKARQATQRDDAASAIAAASFPPIQRVDAGASLAPASAHASQAPADTDIDLPLDVALPPAPPLPPITTCAQCLSSVTPDDVFCGVCGYRLK